MRRQSLSEAAGIEVSDETFQRCQSYCDLVEKWNPRINLIAKASLIDIWARHIVDSAQLFPIAPALSFRWADLGSGGGFPGLVLAILSRQAAPDRTHVLIESDQRKAVFLREAARVLDCRVSVISDRIEQVDAVGADVVTARALAPLPQLLGLVAHHVRPEGVGILPKGGNFELELTNARKDWQFDVMVYPSFTGQDGRILQISGLTARTESR